ncbi:uncharacterized protein LOC144542127 [Centroberyx gerrardi]
MSSSMVITGFISSEYTEVYILCGTSGSADSECLVNISSAQPSLTLVLHISAATGADSGRYYCKTQPPNALSNRALIQVAEGPSPPVPSGDPSSPPGSPAPNLTTPNTHTQGTSAAGLLGQMWWWVLLAKIAILLHMLTYLAAKCH